MTIVLVKEKRIYALIVFALIVFFNQQAIAQTDLEQRQQANKTFDEHLNKVYENNLPNQKSTTYSALTPSEIAAGWKGGKTMSEKQRYNAENPGSKQMIYNEYTEHWDAVYSINTININQSDSKLLGAAMHKLAAKSHLYLADKIDWYKDLYFATAMNSDLVLQLSKIKALDYDSASDAVLKFSKETSTNHTRS